MLKTISNSLMTIQPLMVRQCQAKRKLWNYFEATCVCKNVTVKELLGMDD